MIRSVLNHLSNGVENLITNAKLNYVVESKDWAVKQVGYDLTSCLNKNRIIKSRITVTSAGLRNKIIHFGSINTYSNSHESNKKVLTWYHITKDDKNLKNIKEIGRNIDIIHTTSRGTRQAFLDMGADEDKIVTIPIGVDLNLFRPTSIEGYWELRAKFGIPPDVKVIGSFQKDGDGWGEGNEPKWVKNPQMFVEAVKQLNNRYNGKIFVLLLGAARGYVKTMLSTHGIRFKHVYLEDFRDVAKYYRVLDLYLVTSRSEGMPKAILESMASGIPIISTMVGIAPEIIRNGKNGFVVATDDVVAMSDYASNILSCEGVARTLRQNGIETASRYSWDGIAKRFYNEIYTKLIS